MKKILCLAASLLVSTQASALTTYFELFTTLGTMGPPSHACVLMRVQPHNTVVSLFDEMYLSCTSDSNVWQGQQYVQGYDFYLGAKVIYNLPNPPFPMQDTFLSRGYVGPSGCIYNASTGSQGMVRWRATQSTEWEGSMILVQGSCSPGGGGGPGSEDP